jgi:hypothetical protein
MKRQGSHLKYSAGNRGDAMELGIGKFGKWKIKANSRAQRAERKEKVKDRGWKGRS